MPRTCQPRIRPRTAAIAIATRAATPTLIAAPNSNANQSAVPRSTLCFGASAETNASAALAQARPKPTFAARVRSAPIIALLVQRPSEGGAQIYRGRLQIRRARARHTVQLRHPASAELRAASADVN